MKKSLFISLIAAVFLLPSCKKDYTCSCTWRYNGADSIVQSFTFHETKTKATEACKAQETLAASATILEVTCHL